MPLLSIVPPSYAPVQAHVKEAWASVTEQSLPAGWACEWVIEEDGDDGPLADLLPVDERIRVESGPRGGVALTRNMALARARRELVRNLDMDDVLTAGALDRDIEVLTNNPDAWWTTSRVLDPLPDGSTAGFDHDPPHGRFAPGAVVEHWRSHNFRLPVHPTTICIRRLAGHRPGRVDGRRGI